MNRADRRAAARQQRHHTKPTARKCEALGSPVGIAALQSEIAKNIAALRVNAGLATWLGADPAKLLGELGQLLFMTCYCINQGWGDPEYADVNIMMGMAESLGDIQIANWRLEELRPSLQVGMLALQRVMDTMGPLQLATGAVQLQALLDAGYDLGTQMLREMVSGRAA
ncbi:hypothetical protein PSQ39_21275 [Curvibacter sp. HBC28]|uniref:Uncharacterized protein n=1 Tax=Curvibacter microcysteis TaxID=3026419 RepID=A0ABT5MLB3_9BURK|nr:hypothetical protein [Curvibacter sp. HBC28]MDD0817180.1 hypothetical protein [Curvibacter sp. HBC28]